MATLTTTENDRLQHAIDLLVKGTSVELPFDATIIEEVGRVADSSGFLSAGAFQEQAKTNPISVLLRFIKFIGT